MGWVKLHDDILSDPKLMRAARSPAGEHLYLLPWFLAFANKSADNGRLSVGIQPAEPEDLAYQIPGVTAAQVESGLRALVAIGVLTTDDDGCLRFAKWESRQAKPSTSKTAVRERVARHREKAKSGNKGSNAPLALQGVTPPETGGVTGVEKEDVTPCNATEEKRREEKRRDVEEKFTAIAVTNSVAEPPPRAAEPLPKPICDAAYERWLKIGGAVNYGRFRKVLLPVFESRQSEPPTQEELVNAVDAFGEARAAEKVNFRGKYTINYFAETLRDWVRLGGMPLVDEWGNPTERGLASGVAA